MERHKQQKEEEEVGTHQAGAGWEQIRLSGGGIDRESRGRGAGAGLGVPQSMEGWPKPPANSSPRDRLG